MKLRKCDRCGVIAEKSEGLPRGWATIKLILLLHGNVTPDKKAELIRGSGEQEVCPECFDPAVLEALEFISANTSSPVAYLSLDARKAS